MDQLIKIYAMSDPRLDRVLENVRYVGKTSKPLRVRLSAHLCRKNTAHKSQWIRSIEAMGMVPAIWPLAFCNSENWQDVEKEWIAKLRLTSNLTNVMDGGGAEVDWTSEMRAKISIARRKKRMPFSELHRQRIRIALTGRKSSPEHVAKASLALTGKKRSPEVREKMKLAQAHRLGVPRPPHAEETKIKIRLAHLGIKCPDSAKLKISKANSIPIVCFDTGVVFPSAASAGKFAGVAAQSITRAVRSNVECAGLLWRYANP